MTKKNKILIIISSIIAIICLVLGCLFLTKQEEDVDSLNPSFNNYQTALHNVAQAGEFPLNSSALMNALNQHLTEEFKTSFQDGALYCASQDEYGRNLVIELISDNMTAIVARGKDGTLHTEDDIKTYVIINRTNDGFDIFTYSSNGCEHAYHEADVISQASCKTIGLSKTECTVCGNMRTSVKNVKEHSFNTTLECGTVATCTVCQLESESPVEHVFTGMNMADKYLAIEGNCTFKEKYYYSCINCGEKSTETFDGGYNKNNHFGETKMLSFQVDDFTKFERLVCGRCDKELLSVTVKDYNGVVTPELKSIELATEFDVMYATSPDGEYTSELPMFGTHGIHSVYYRVYDDLYEIKGVAYVTLNDTPKLIVNNFDTTSWEHPRLYNDTTIVLNGQVIDQNPIVKFTINGIDVAVNENGAWTYEVEISKFIVSDFVFYVEDLYGGTYEVRHFVSYNPELLPNITVDPNISEETIHVSDNQFVLTGHIINSAYVSSISVNGQPASISSNTWSYNVEVVKNAKTTLTIITTDIDGNESIKNLIVCHCDIYPYMSFELFDGYQLIGTIEDRSRCNKSYIESIKVFGTTMDYLYFACPGIEFDLNDGELAYLSQGENIREIDFSFELETLPVNSFTIEITTTHGERVQYVFNINKLEDGTSLVQVVEKDLIRDTSTTYIVNE